MLLKFTSRLGFLSVASLLMLVVLGCSSQAPVQPVGKRDPLVGKVLVVINENSPASVIIGQYYAERRQIPLENVLRIQCTANEKIPENDFNDKILGPIRKASKGIDYVVLTRGIPIKLAVPQEYSVDMQVAAMDLPGDPIADLTQVKDFGPWINPYYQKSEPQSRETTHLIMVTRLDGYTVEDAKQLVDSSISAKKSFGPYFLNTARNKDDGGYMPMQQSLRVAEVELKRLSMDVTLQENTFKAPKTAVMGYASWGSNDPTYKESVYRSIQFLPGALAQTFVSTSARTFRPTKDGQSLVADLIAQKVTGVIGYVSEPYALSLARPDVLFSRYVKGANLAEASYASIPFIKWKEVVIGDPLCRPYGID